MPKKLTTEEFIKRAKEIHGNKYDYSLVNYKNNNTKIKIICPIHGVFEQRPDNHLRNNGCPKCCIMPRKFFNLKELIEELSFVHNNKYDYSLIKEKPKNFTFIVKIVCPIHGVFEQKLCNHLHGCGCPKCKESHGEQKIRNWLIENNYKDGKDFFSQYKFSECRYKKELPFDFYIPSKKLLIEYQGQQHYDKNSYYSKKNNNYIKIKKRDKIKKDFCKNNNFTLLEISYKNFQKIPQIMEEILCK